MEEKEIDVKILAEQCFVEIDIASKCYLEGFGEDNVYDEVSLLHTTIAYILTNHKEDHKLANISLENFKIPDSNYKDEDGNTIDILSEVNDSDKLHYITDLVMNSKFGIMELTKRGYFEDIGATIMDAKSLAYQTMNIFDRILLLMNNKYSKLILKIK